MILTYNAIIESASMQRQGSFLLLSMSFKREDGWRQGLGSLCLYNSHKDGESYAGKTLHKLLKIARSETLAGAVGKAVKIKASDHEVMKVGHIFGDEWLDV